MIQKDTLIDKQLWYEILLNGDIVSKGDLEIIVLVYLLNTNEAFDNICFNNMLYSAPYINTMAILANKINDFLNLRQSKNTVSKEKWWDLICNGINDGDNCFNWDIKDSLKEAVDKLIEENIIDINIYKNNKKYFECENISPKEDINYLISSFEYNFANKESDKKQISSSVLNLNETMSVEDIIYSPIMNSKILYENFADKVIPIYYSEHIINALLFFQINIDPIRRTDGVYLCNLLIQYKDNNPIFNSWSSFKFISFVFKMIIKKDKYYKVFIDDNEEYWRNCFNNNYIRIGWDDIGDISRFKDYVDFREQFTEMYSYYEKNELIKNINELWMFYTLEKDDIVVAVKDNTTVLGIGRVIENGYNYDITKGFFKHIVGVNWKKDFISKIIDSKNGWERSSIEPISTRTYEEIIEGYEDNIDDINTFNVNLENLDGNTIINDEVKFFEVMERNLKRKGSIILCGVAGSGKTYEANQFIKWYKKKNDIVTRSCSFHPEFKYENFVEGYENNYYDKEKNIKNGIFKELCIEASKDESREYFIIIDEINRGDIEKIFGEMINLIEKERRSKPCILSISGEEFYVPQNIYIIATMNISDKRVIQIDSSLRRRFSMIKCNIDYSIISSYIEGSEISPGGILKIINNRLSEVVGEEKQIGHAFFMEDGTQISTLLQLKDVIFYDIIPLIFNYCLNEYDKIYKVIGENLIRFENEGVNITDDELVEELQKEFLLKST